ncbi:AMP-binding protein [Rhodoblastus sp.]|jgi:long-chain acyl-CoA synthetase|uniref:AMP-binding protein n=1 Tax=Rhodoblastus sp. TaxID=1962975 RepID=UPI0025FE7C2E|nr:AMP-binding protein [Rhodoblastus sp.]
MEIFEELVGARPWIAHYPDGVPAEIAPDPHTTLVDLWRRSRSAYGARVALESFGARLTYEQLGAAADQVTAWLQDAGLGKGDRVAIMSPNVMAYPAILLGVLQAGGTVVNVNPLYTSRELEFQIVDASPRFLFVLENFAATVAAVADRLNLERIVLIAPGDLLGPKGVLVNFVSRHVKKAVPKCNLPKSIAFSAALRATRGKSPRAVNVAADDIAVLQYTGGTTGSAKGAMLLHRNLVANIEQSAAWFGGQLSSFEKTVMVTALPLYHIYALTTCFWFQMRVGGACLLVANPRDIPGFVKILRGSRFHIFAGVNTLYNVLADHPDIAKVDFSSLLFSTAGGMAMQQAVARKWLKLTGKAVIEGYGLSETSPVLCANRPDLEEFSGTVGYPLPSTEISIRNSAGEPVPMGEAGEICARGPQVMAGYWDRPMATEAAMTKDGFFRTGDVAVMLPDGQVKIVDRLKDIIIVSGFNVYPNEVEEILVEHPKVREAAVIGRPLAATGEEVIAFVVPREEGLTENELRAFCRERLTGYKVPREFFFREELPKSNVGKVLRRSLKDSLGN